jgi:DEAD/DEAH box helicase domain-containing protein
MNSDLFLKQLTAYPSYVDQIAHVEHLPSREAVYGELEAALPAALEMRLKEMGRLPLYRHQAEAVNHVRNGDNIMVATPSASGKTLCYNLPVLEKLLTDARSRALYLYPTKALAQDQLRAFRELAGQLISPTEAAIFDGDTPQAERAALRKHARLILSNPDMLHVGILPNHHSWSVFLRNLKYVILDEAPVYRGVFGSHVALVIRRLRRLCALYNSQPQFVFCSATIANPGEHAERLTGLPFTVVSSDGSPRGSKEFVFWNPPIVDKEKATRRSPNSEATHLFTRLISQEVRTLAFTRTRRLTELIYTYARDQLAESSASLSRRIRPYRAGYLPVLRREIEKALFSGELLGVIATNALELGIDIGDLEATILNGYPGSIASTWQQAGRSGRSGDGSLSFLIAMDNPLDQYFMRHPEAFFTKSAENALINPHNPYILRAHLLCAAWERALAGMDEAYFGFAFTPGVKDLVAAGQLVPRKDSWYLTTAIGYPAQSVGIRGVSGERYALRESASGALLETIEADTAFFQIYPGAIYLHQGEPYLITQLDIPARTATAEPTALPYYTDDKELTDLRIRQVHRRKKIGDIEVSVGDVGVTTVVSGFKKKKHFTDEVIGEEALDLPPIHFETVGLWFDLPQGGGERIFRDGLDYAGGLHAVEHAAIAILPLFALCDRNDIGGVSTPLHADTRKAQVFIYDAYPGGTGIAEKGYELIEQLWQATLQVVTECPCQDGCPSCIQSPKCGNNNEPLDKKAARILLEGLMEEAKSEEVKTP